MGEMDRALQGAPGRQWATQTRARANKSKSSACRAANDGLVSVRSGESQHGALNALEEQPLSTLTCPRQGRG